MYCKFQETVADGGAYTASPMYPPAPPRKKNRIKIRQMRWPSDRLTTANPPLCKFATYEMSLLCGNMVVRLLVGTACHGICFFQNRHDEFLDVQVQYASHSTVDKGKGPNTFCLDSTQKIINFGFFLMCSVTLIKIVAPANSLVVNYHFLIKVVWLHHCRQFWL
jgi:hypothetical protein